MTIVEQLKIEIQQRYKKLLLNKKEASKELGISISTLDRLRKSGYLREKRIGGGVFFTLDEIVDFIGGVKRSAKLGS